MIRSLLVTPRCLVAAREIPVLAAWVMSNIELYRVIIPAADIDASGAFYANLLDQQAMPVSGGRRYFRCGAVTLAVYSPAGDGDPTTPHANFGHVYFAVDDLEAFFTRARAL